ncbi:hypothetical protein [Calothrix sp. NIES-2098]|uniref:hypothetical protein n=1 Tax=Calothrix sp. NIES-2098 TaxID=1954171 RepID=UPI000BBCB192
MQKIGVAAVTEVVLKKLLVNSLLARLLLFWVGSHLNQVHKQSISGLGLWNITDCTSFRELGRQC